MSLSSVGAGSLSVPPSGKVALTAQTHAPAPIQESAEKRDSVLNSMDGATRSSLGLNELDAASQSAPPQAPPQKVAGLKGGRRGGYG